MGFSLISPAISELGFFRPLVFVIMQRLQEGLQAMTGRWANLSATAGSQYHACNAGQHQPGWQVTWMRNGLTLMLPARPVTGLVDRTDKVNSAHQLLEYLRTAADLFTACNNWERGP